LTVHLAVVTQSYPLNNLIQITKARFKVIVNKWHLLTEVAVEG